MKKLSSYLLMLTLLFVFTTPTIANTYSKSIETPDEYNQIQCLDYSFADFQNALMVMNVAINKTSSNTLSGSRGDYADFDTDTDTDTDSLNISINTPIDGNRQRMHSASKLDESSEFSMGFRNGDGPVFLVHYPLE